MTRVSACACRLFTNQQTTNQVHGNHGRSLAHVDSPTRKGDRAGDALSPGPFAAEPPQAHALIFAAPARARDAGETPADVGAEPLPRSLGERVGHLLGDGSVRVAG